MNLNALLNTLGTRCRTLPLVILYVTEGCNLRCITCSYRKPLPNELTLEEISRLAVSLKEFGLRHIVFSGGEPLMRRDFPEICEVFYNLGVKQTLITNGLLLEKRLQEIHRYLTEIIVSIDGPNEQIHNGIRGIDSFTQILIGIRKATSMSGPTSVSLRTVLQKQNFRSIMDMVHLAKALVVTRISFLAADVLTESFGRNRSGKVVHDKNILLDDRETIEFRAILNEMISSCNEEFRTGFISESPEKLLHIVEYFESLIENGPLPRTICNAPMLSTVITSTGDLLPCFFLPTYGNLRDAPLPETINNPRIRSTRSDVRNRSLDRCKTCVCTLHVKPHTALLDRF